MSRLLRSIFAMQTVRERAERELVENARAIFEAEKAIHHKRAELALLRKRGTHLVQLTEVA